MPKIPNFLKTVLHQIYLLQLENYDLGRYVKRMAGGMLFPLVPPRKPIVWTPKLVGVTLLGLALGAKIAFGFGALAYLVFNSPSVAVIVFAAVAILLSAFYFLLLCTILTILSPVDWLIKTLFVFLARVKMKGFHGRVIGITGSYGKTTMKDILGTILSERFRVLKTPENLNTPLGMARVILGNLRSEAEIFVAEMGAYRRGDIAGLCGIARPDIGVLTGINEAHLERFGSIGNTIAAKFEIVSGTASTGTVLLNGGDQRVHENYQKYVGERKVLWYGSSEPLNSPAYAKASEGRQFSILNSQFHPDGSGISFELVAGEEFKGYFKVPFLGMYIVPMIEGAIMIARKLGMEWREIQRGIVRLVPPPHRLVAIRAPGGVLVIDDSYNGNKDGAFEAISVLGKFVGKRRIYVTPGVAEAGKETERIHREIGERLARAADKVVLIRNSATPFIEKGLRGAGFPTENILWFNHAAEAHQAVSRIAQAGDVIMFQNDWPDNYL